RGRLSSNPNWQQLSCATPAQLARLIQLAPVEHLVRVHPVCPCYPRHRRTRNQRLFDNPPLLRNAPPLPLGCDRGLSTLGNDCNLLGSVHLRSKWTPVRSVHFARMALIYGDVQTAIGVRLPQP